MRLIFLSILLCLFVSTSLSGQEYKSAIGLRLGVPVSASYKTFIGDSASALEVFLGFSTNSYGAALLGSRYRRTSISLGANFQVHNEIPVDGLSWYYGGGPSVYYWSYSDDFYFEDSASLGFGVHANAGADYKFANIPLNVSVDWMPTVIFNGYNSGFRPGYGAVSARYVLQE